MILFDFDVVKADSLEEARRMLASGDARFLAGGTDLLPRMRAKLVEPETLVSLGGIAPSPPALLPDGSLRLHALARLADLAASEVVKRHAPMLVESVMAVGSNQIRHMGTLGGNLCQESRCLYLDQKHDYQFVQACYKRGGDCCYPFPRNKPDTCWAVHMSDVAPALVALDATVEVLGESGARTIPAAALYSGNGLNPLSLGAAELITAVTIPPASANAGWAFHKATVRGGLEFALAVIAITLQAEPGRKTCGVARIVVGAVREAPVRLTQTEAALKGAVLDDTRIEEIAAKASQEVNPLPHHGVSRRYLLENVRVNLRRSLAAARERALRV